MGRSDVVDHRDRVLIRARAFFLAVVPLLVLSSTAVASEPVMWHISDGGRQYALPDTFATVWIQEPDLNGTAGSSEVIGQYNLETEIADDFLFDEATSITAVRWWGVYWNGFEEPIVGGFNLRFYEDNGCLPGDFVGEVIIPNNCFETLRL